MWQLSYPTHIFSQLLISWREDKHQDQEIMKDPVEKGRISLKIFDIIEANRILSHSNPEEHIVPDSAQSEILYDTGKAKRNSYIAKRCAAINGKSFHQLPPDFRYENSSGNPTKYLLSDMKYDIKKST